MRYMLVLGVIICAVGVGLIISSGGGTQERDERAESGNSVVSQGHVHATSRPVGSDDPSFLMPSVNRRSAAVWQGERAPSAVEDRGTPSPTQSLVGAPKGEIAQQQLGVPLKAAAKDPKLTEDVSQATTAIAEEGGDPAAVLLGKYRSGGSVQQRSAVISALRELGTPDAENALAKIAMDPGADGFTLGERAVKAYAAMKPTTNEMVQLLDSTENRVRTTAIREMAGLPLDSTATARLGKELESESWITRQLVAQVFGADKESAAANEKIRILMSAAKAVSSLEGAEQIVPWAGYTRWEMVLGSYAGALGSMPDAAGALKQYLAAEDPTQCALAAIALARTGDMTAHNPVVSVIRGSDDGFLRTMAVSALAKLATQQDKTFLQNLAKNDPYKRPSPEKEGEWQFPVREAAERVLRTMSQAPPVPPTQ